MLGDEKLNDIERIYRDRVGDALEKYCPNDSVLNNISTYLFREAISVLKETGQIEINEFKENSEIDRLSFLHAIKDLSVFATQTILTQVIKKSFSEVKNSIQLDTRDLVEKRVVDKNSTTPVAYPQGFSQNEASFDIDVSRFSRVEKVERPAKKETKVIEPRVDQNVFKGDVHFDMDEINQRTVRSNISFKKTDRVESSDGDGKFYEDLRTDASKYTEDSYSEIPNISIDGDY